MDKHKLHRLRADVSDLLKKDTAKQLHVLYTVTQQLDNHKLERIGIEVSGGGGKERDKERGRVDKRGREREGHKQER